MNFLGLAGRCVVACGLLMVVGGVFRCKGGGVEPRQGKKAAAVVLTTADRWAGEAAEIVGGPKLLDLTQGQMAERLKRMGVSCKSDAEKAALLSDVARGGVLTFMAGFDGSAGGKAHTLDQLKLTLQRADGDGHEVYPRLRRLLAKRFVRPMWSAYPGWESAGPDGNKEAGWHYAGGHYALRLVDTGWSLTLELLSIENDNEIP